MALHQMLQTHTSLAEEHRFKALDEKVEAIRGVVDRQTRAYVKAVRIQGNRSDNRHL